MADESIESAKRYLDKAEYLVIFAGAGMSADSGIRTFRGNAGLWTGAAAKNKNSIDLASYNSLINTPDETWAFYHERREVAQIKEPHQGYYKLLELCENVKSGKYFIFTSNTDRYFHRAGFSDGKIFECHGNINTMYCINPHCTDGRQHTEISGRRKEVTPRCSCGSLMRPNVFMFGDRSFDHEHVTKQKKKWSAFKDSTLNAKPYVVLEIGVGSVVSTVEDEAWNLSKQALAVIQINPDKPAPEDTYCPWISIELGAKDAIAMTTHSSAKDI